MLLNANIDSNKTEILLQEYINLVKRGVSQDSILFLVQNSYRKKYVAEYLEKNNIVSDAISTFQGLIYKTINNNWDFLSSKIKIGTDKTKPNLCSMELSQFIMNRSIKEVGFKDYFSKINLLHQLFRRYYLILNNDLDDLEVKNRSELLSESWGKDADNVLKKYEEKTLQYRSFDYLRQMPLFKYIYKNSDYFSKIKYLFLDDADEITQFEFNFIKFLTPNLKDYFIAFDEKGCSRAGYLSAKKNIKDELTKLFKVESKYINKNNFQNKRADIIFNNFLDEKKNTIDKIEFSNSITRLRMIKKVCIQIDNLVKQGIKYQDIAVVTPELDFYMENFLVKYLQKNSYTILSGNKKLSQNNDVKNILSILKLANPLWNITINEYEVNSLLNKFSNIPLSECQDICTEFKRVKKLVSFEMENDNYKKEYKKLLDIIENIRLMSLSDAVKTIIFSYPNLDNEQVNFLLKKIQEFEYLFSEKKNDKKVQKNIIMQFESSMIAENSTEKDIDIKKIIVSTPQKFIDIEHHVKYLFLLDLTGSQWMVEDVGNIYNAWAFQSDWDKKKIEYMDLYNLTKDKTARMLRKIALLCSDTMYGYSSCYNSTGYENLFGIMDFLNIEQGKNSVTTTIIPRDDQRPVLEYKNGHLAIAAVPGAGKTTILLALIIKLLGLPTPAENIFVLTYMDSAAKHFKEKLLEYLPDLKTLPNISTIHGLCLKILKDNSNYLKVGLNSDFSVCGEADRKNFIITTLYKLNLKEDEFDKYDKAVSMAKLNPEIDTKHNKNLQFQRFFDEYNKVLSENFLIDYDDMLFYAVKLLRENDDILKIYQEQCHYIIEDEAQDSSLIQQELLNLLSQKNKNLIRCGDPNQAITSTFTNADIKGFVSFIDTNKNVKMDISQRCSKPIYSFANELVSMYPKAFFKNIMQGTKNNPDDKTGVNFLEFENDSLEKDFILNEIQKIYQRDKNASIAILLRNNYQVENYSAFLESHEIKTVEKTDNLKNTSSYNIILAYLEMLQYPYNNKILSEGLKKLSEQNLYAATNEDIEILKNLTTPFVKFNPDEVDSYTLNKFWWDFNYIFSKSNNSLDFLACMIADYYVQDEIELENAYMLSQVIKSMQEKVADETAFIERLRMVKNLSNLGSVKFVKEDKTENNVVQIMTIHKSKGDEFDYVFVPEFSSKQFPLNIEDVRVSGENYFCECLKEKTKIKTKDILKQEQMNETLRLIYVAITRAKKGLFLSYSKALKYGSKRLLSCEIYNIKN